jgi:hypothetical protein
MKMNKQIVSVVFDFDLNTMEARPGAQHYTYFFVSSSVVLEEGEPVVVISPHTNQLTVVLVVDVAPSADAVAKATKAIVGLVDVTPFEELQEEYNEAAVEQAWGRFKGNC